MSVDESAFQSLPSHAQLALEHALVKLKRAEHHYAELLRSSQEYIAREPFHAEDFREGGVRSFVFRIREPIPSSISAIAGDVIHNARATLDYLTYKAVEVNGQVPTRHTQFPVTEDKKAFDFELKKHHKANSRIHNVGPRVLRLLHHLRPYAGGNEILWRLHKLDVHDKHKLLIVAGAAHKTVDFELKTIVPWSDEPIVFPRLAIRPADRQFPLQDGDIMVTGKDEEDPNVKFFDNVKFQVELCMAADNVVDGKPLTEVFNEILPHVKKIAYLFGRFVFS